MSLSDEDKQWINGQIDRRIDELKTALFEKVRNPYTPEELRLRKRASFPEMERLDAECEAMRPHLRILQPPADRT